MQRIESKCIALYKKNKQEINIREFIKFALNFFDNLGIKPNYMGVTGEGYPKKIINFSLGQKRIEKQSFNNIETINLIYTDSLSDAPTYDWLFSISLSVYDGVRFFLGGDKDLLSNLAFDGVVKSIGNFFIIDYGYMFCREFSKGPEYYIAGVSYGNLPDNEANYLTSWFKDSLNSKSYASGKLRDIYEINVLTSKHLNFNLEDRLSLKEFIDSQELTILQKISDDLFLWHIPNNLIMEIRFKLSQFNILISYDIEVKPSSCIEK